MTSTNLIGSQFASLAEPRLARHNRGELSFMAILEAAHSGGDAGAPRPGLNRLDGLLSAADEHSAGEPFASAHDPALHACVEVESSDPLLSANTNADTAPVQRFDETSVLGAATLPAANARSSPSSREASEAARPAALDNPPKRAPAPRLDEMTLAPPRFNAPTRTAVDRRTPDPSPGPALVSGASAIAAKPSRASTVVAERAQAIAAPAARRVAPQSQNLNPVFVALHATEAEFAIYARPGRMAPTERERLRNAISALLNEYGFSNARITLEESMGAHHG
jgi:hypothetical protein